MQQLFAFLYRYRVFGFFLALELICVWLIISYNSFYNASFFNSSNAVAANIQQASANTADYRNLRSINADLAAENARLRKELYGRNLTLTNADTARLNYFEITPASVINNSYRKSTNYMTIDRGMSHGVQPGLGVLSQTGVAGVVKSASGSFATVVSLLHQNLMVSSQLRKTKTLCTTQWAADGPLTADVKYIPRHIPISVGDTIETSGFNSVFPEGIPIGIVDTFELPDESPFYIAKLRLMTDFSSIKSVYVIRNEKKQEIDSLEAIL